MFRFGGITVGFAWCLSVGNECNGYKYNYIAENWIILNCKQIKQPTEPGTANVITFP